jgi:DNA ligase (NAD+)
MLKHDFDILNQQRQEAGLSLFKNPRNLAAGTIRQLDPQLVADRPLRFIGYDIFRDDLTDTPTIAFGYSMLMELGITTSGLTKVVHGAKEVMTYVSHLDEIRHDLPFNTDGAVIKLNDRFMFSKLGTV